MRAIFQWKIGTRVLELGRRTLIMGIVNVTPDSFSDGGQYIDASKAVAHAEKLLDEGAAIIDVGGESTRPGTVTDGKGTAGRGAVSEEEEKKRVLPVIRDLKKRRPESVVSVDTYKAGVARAAIGEGAEIVNDISGFRWDSKIAKTIAELKVGAVLMHSRGKPEEWKNLPPIGDPVLTVKRELRQWAEAATLAGIKRDYLVLDPGFGFGKKMEENYPLLAHFAELQLMGFPLLAGVSRKSFLGRALAHDGKDAVVEERGFGTLAAETILILKGAHILRTHDVRQAVEAARVADTIVASGG
ncbi:MAG TPA: dihydropteroate synthase [Terriglobales bacterium]|nr:dihydropteroate synthase [Terriglobales bacterium]